MSSVTNDNKNIVSIERPPGDIFNNQQLRSVAFCFLGFMEFVITNEKTQTQKRYSLNRDSNHGNCYYLSTIASHHNYIGYFKTKDIQKLQFKLNKPKRTKDIRRFDDEYQMIKILFENVAKLSWPDKILLSLDSSGKCPICGTSIETNSFYYLLSMHLDCYLNGGSYKAPPKIMSIVRSTEGIIFPTDNIPEQPHKEIT